MKIYINTITPQDLMAIHEQELKDGVKEDNLTSSTPVIDGYPFPPGEWKHVPDDFVVDAKLYPFIKEAHIVLEERTAAALQEKGLDAFAQGLKEAAVKYAQAEPAIVADVQKYAPIAVAVETEEPIEVVKP